MIKRGPLELDYRVMPLEGLWWADHMTAFTAARKEEWKWTLMIMQPSLISHEMVEKLWQKSRERKTVQR